MNDRVAIEGRGQLVLGLDEPDLAAGTLDPGDDSAGPRQRAKGLANSLLGAQVGGARHDRDTATLEEVEHPTQGRGDLRGREAHAPCAEEQRRDQSHRRDGRGLVDPPSHLEGRLLESQLADIGIGGGLAAGGAEHVAHRHRLTEADIDLAEVALALGLDEAEEPTQALGGLTAALGVGGVLPDLVELVKADGHGLQEDVVGATGQIGLRGVAEQAELGRQHLAGARAPALDRPREVEALLGEVADELLEHVLVELVPPEAAADEDRAAPTQDRTHRPERHVDPGEEVWQRQALLVEDDVEHRGVEVAAVRPQEDHGVRRHGRAEALDLSGHDVDLGVETALEDHPVDARDEVDEEPSPTGGEFVEDLLGFRLRRLVGADARCDLVQAGLEAR